MISNNKISKLLVKKRFGLFFFIFYLNLACAEVIAQNRILLPDELRTNIFKVTAGFVDEDKKTGLGFTVREANDYLYIVTANQILTSNYGLKRRELRVWFDKNEFAEGSAIEEDVELDLALLRISKPRKYKWDYDYRTLWVREKDDIWIVRNTEKWEDYSDLRKGQVTEERYFEIKADFADNQEGLVGGPLIKEGKVAGMVIHDEGDRVTALHISKIQDKVTQWLNVKFERKSAYPFFTLGMLGSVGGDFYNDAGQYGYSYSFQAFLSPIFAVQFERNYCYVKTYRERIDLIDYQFKNKYTSNSISLLLNYAPFNENWDVYGCLYLGLGYSRIMNMNPQVSIDGGDWINLNDVENTNYDYSNKANAYKIYGGLMFSWPSLPRSLLFNIELGVQYYPTRYVLFDIKKLYSEGDSKDWSIFMNVGVRVGTIIGKRKTKLLD